MYQRAGTSSGGGGGSAPELLWVNPDNETIKTSTSYSFAAQTINENSNGWKSGKHISDYKQFLFGCCYTRGRQDLPFSFMLISTQDGLSSIWTLMNNRVGANNNNTTGGSFRDVTISNSGIAFGAAGGGNSFGIPMYIWGIKDDMSFS